MSLKGCLVCISFLPFLLNRSVVFDQTPYVAFNMGLQCFRTNLWDGRQLCVYTMKINLR